jgi:uncharacterized protein (TIGR00297 family)
MSTPERRLGIPLRLALGAALAAVIASLAVRQRALDRGGALAAVLVGTLTFAAGGLAWSRVMIGFFVTGSLLSRVGRQHKRAAATQGQRGQRDARQVLANGGLAALFAALHLMSKQRSDWSLPFLGAIASAAADTWATEIGMLSAHPPRSLRTGRPVPPGTSGAVSLLGLLGMVAGASFVALLAPRGTPRLPIAVAGCLGALADSLFGATLQARYSCSICQRSLEQPAHPPCPGPAQRVSGFPGLTNDAVNALATLVGAALASRLGHWTRRMSASRGS